MDPLSGRQRASPSQHQDGQKGRRCRGMLQVVRGRTNEHRGGWPTAAEGAPMRTAVPLPIMPEEKSASAKGYCPRSLAGGPLGHCGTLPQKPSQYCWPTPCSQATRLKKLSPAHRAMASLICCQRLGCTAEDAPVVPWARGPAGDSMVPVDPGGEAVVPVDPGGPPGTTALP